MEPKMRLTSGMLVVVLVTILLLTPAAGAAGPARIVAVGDVHGAFPELVSILQRTGLVNGERRWSGGSTILVQTGDILDRGAQARACLDLLMALQPQAEKAGGKLIALYGNHEAMNLMGDLRYVTPEIFSTFGNDRSESVRAQAYQDYLKYMAGRRGNSRAAVADDDANRRQWMDAHPPGFFEYRDALGPRGSYGRWIRTHHAVVKVGDGVFVHGGLNPALDIRSIGELDDRVRAEVADFDALWQSLVDKKVIWRYMQLQEALTQVEEELKSIQAQGRVEDAETVDQIRKLLGYRAWMAVSSDGPLWYRGLAQEPEEKLSSGVTSMLERLKAQFVVEGHTVLSKSDITPRFDNRVFLIDTGMLKEEYAGRASALEILDGKFTAYYADGEPKALGAPASQKKVPATGSGAAWR